MATIMTTAHTNNSIVNTDMPRRRGFSPKLTLAALALTASMGGTSCDNTALRSYEHTVDPLDVASALGLIYAASRVIRSSSDITSERVLVYGRESREVDY